MPLRADVRLYIPMTHRNDRYTFGVAVPDEGVGTSSLYCTVASAFSPDVTVISLILDSNRGGGSGSGGGRSTPTTLDALLATVNGGEEGSGGGGGGGAARGDGGEVLTMVATTALVEGSPLHATMNLVSKDDGSKTPSKGKSGGGGGLKKKRGVGAAGAGIGSTNSPITFGNKIRYVQRLCPPPHRHRHHYPLIHIASFFF